MEAVIRMRPLKFSENVGFRFQVGAADDALGSPSTISLLYVLQVATTIAYVTDSGEAINNEVIEMKRFLIES